MSDIITVYGIANCDTIKKARRWLDENGIEYRFHDYRKDGITAARLKAWADELGWEALLNRRGTTWRRLDEEQRNTINKSRAITLMAAQPALIKRPLLDTGKHKLLGFNADEYKRLLA
jgi:Spx/MgsR family transcriptional regulator